MSRALPKNSSAIAAAIGLAVMLLGGLVTAGVWYYASPNYFRVGYEPLQPIAFSHQIHVGGLGMDCLYCHTNVKESPHANIPSTATCMNCHDAAKGNIKSDSPALAPLREAFKTGRPVEWMRVHKVPDFVYFNHQVHVTRGVACVSCHGRIDQMETVRHAEPLSMSWCLDCHRNPGPNLRPAAAVTSMSWDARTEPLFATKSQGQFANELIRQSGIHPPTNCTGCHR